MDKTFDHKEIEELPYLIKLLEDPTPKVRQVVVDKLLTFCVYLDAILKEHKINLSAEQEWLLNTHVKSLLKEKSHEAPIATPIFKAGDLVEHKRYNYRGLVVDLDSNCQASDEWYKNNQSQPDRSQSWYYVLVHNSSSVTYAAESSLNPAKCCDPIIHPLLPFFFDGFNGSSYLRNERRWGSF